MALSMTLRTGATARPITRGGKLNAALWIVQALLGVLFLATGLMKLTMPMDVLMAQMQLPLPVLFVRFLGLCELSGALGLVLPGLLRIRTGLTPLAASGLVIIMIGATLVTLVVGGGATALMPLIIGMLAGGIAYGRTALHPIRSRRS